METRKPTQIEIRSVVKDYHAFFPDWQLAKSGWGFYRISGPVMQQLGFVELSGLRYRPQHGVRCLPALAHPSITDLMSVKFDSIRIKFHNDKKVLGCVTEMKERFVPALDRPIDLEEVIDESLRRQPIELAGTWASIAALCASAERLDEALRYCTLVHQMKEPDLAPIPEWEVEFRNFARDLVDAIESKTHQTFLEAKAEEGFSRLKM